MPCSLSSSRLGLWGFWVLNSHLSCPTWLNERILDLSSNWVCWSYRRCSIIFHFPSFYQKEGSVLPPREILSCVSQVDTKAQKFTLCQKQALEHSRSASPILKWVQVPWGCYQQADSSFVPKKMGLRFCVSEQSPVGGCWLSLLSMHWIARSHRTCPQTRSISFSSQWCVMKAFLKTLQVDQPCDNLVSDTGVASLTKIRKTTSRVWISGDHALQRNCPVVIMFISTLARPYPSSCTYDLSLATSQSFLIIRCSCAQLCPILCDPMDCSPPGSSVHGILQARTLEWAAISFFGGSSWPRVRTHISCIVGGFFTVWAIREAQEMQ